MMCSRTHLGYSFSFSLSKCLSSLTHSLWHVFLKARCDRDMTQISEIVKGIDAGISGKVQILKLEY